MKTAGCGRKVAPSMLATSEHIPTSIKAGPSGKRNPTFRRIASYNAYGDRINSGGIRRRVVSFASDVQDVGTVPSRSEFTEKEFGDTWYTKYDLKTMKSDFIVTIKKMAKNLPLADDEEARGLEHKTPHGSRSRTDNRYQAMDAILDEQERQWDQGRKDPEYLAKLYRQSSAHCQMTAYLIAEKDADYVKQLLEEDKSRDVKEEVQGEALVWGATEDISYGTISEVKSSNASKASGGLTPTRQSVTLVSGCGSHQTGIFSQRISLPITL